MAADDTNHQMWEKLGIDLAKHDQLLGVLPTIYKQVYVDSQQNRPKGMGFFEFVIGDVHGIRIKELVQAKADGKMIVGTFCLYVPDEIIVALDGVSIGLCGGTNFSNYAIEGVLPTNTCALIKSALGFGFGKICPYYAIADILVGETTCDGKKKAWEVLAKNKAVYVMETPQLKGRTQARTHFIDELKALVKQLEDVSGKRLTAEKLRDAMEKISKKRAQLRRVYETRKANPPPISGKDSLLVSQIAFYDDPDRQIEMVGKLADECEERVGKGEGVVPKDTKRILLSGTPQAVPNWKLHDIVETSGGVIVCEETCTGTRYFESTYELKGDTVDELLERIADRYLGINCACFSPNTARTDDIVRLAREYNVDGVLLYTLSFCDPYQYEAVSLENDLKKAGIKVLSINTDYASEDAGQIKTRVEAFLETLQ
ncbi:MAG: 2-hydroxyacyl-CoA dehydratase [Candidatus Lokiarchaeota archaeon]|nr:2-hydroxyacyl-CoA dehydratase [Candidatus Lokiarchaeota archaeon]